IVFGITTILLFILILFVYNPSFVNYEASFRYQWYGIENGKYANGTIFNFYDIPSLENLRKVKASKIEYENIDVEQLVEGITIELDENVYQMTVQGSFFQSETQAKSFIEDLIRIPYENALNLDFNFLVNLSGYEAANKVSTKLDYLRNQLNLVMQGYQGMIGYFGDIEHLSSLLREVEVFAANDVLSEYEYLAYKNAYMTKEEYRTSIKEAEALTTERELLRERKNLLLDSLKNIYSNSNGNTYMDTSIANYLNSLHALDSRLMTIDENLRHIENANLGKYNEQESQSFLNTLNQYKERLYELSNEYDAAVSAVLEQNTIVNIHSIKSKGKIGVILAILI
ncbi:MAG: hypothetical protein K2K15_02440, partial [Anaeroplasmataceae bacterium]|nr:hypothetical protein [Anaeroplasmataceae bacterium]